MVLNFTPAKMQLAKIVALKKRERDMLNVVFNFGGLHQVQVGPAIPADSQQLNEVQQEFNKTYDRLQKVKSILNFEEIVGKEKNFSVTDVEIDNSFEKALAYVNETLDHYEKEVIGLGDQQTSLSARDLELQSLLNLDKIFRNLGITALDIEGGNQTYSVVGTVFSSTIKRLEFNLTERTDGSCIFFSRDSSDDNYSLVFVTVLNAHKEVVDSILREFNFQAIELLKESLDHANEPSYVADQLDEFTEEERQLDETRQGILSNVASDLFVCTEIMEREKHILDVRKSLRVTENTVTIWGWVPEKKVDDLKYSLEDTLGDDVASEIKDPNFQEKDYPTDISTLGMFQGYKELVNAFGVPNYREINPLFFMVILFPVFFGIMFADVIQGPILALIGAFFIIRKRIKKETTNEFEAYLFNGAWILFFCGISAGIFGFLLGETVGDPTVLEELFGYHSILTWAHKGHVIEFLGVCMVIGYITISIGLLLKVIRVALYSHHHKMVDLTVGILIIIVYWSAGLSILIVTGVWGGFAGSVPAFVGTAVGSIVLMAIIEAKAAGLQGGIEVIEHILSLLSNTVSFGRILALNAVHRTLNEVLVQVFIGQGNHFSDLEGTSGYILWVCGVILACMIVIPVEGIFSFLNSMRLNWIEFFSKFYIGEGYEFNPIHYTSELVSYGSS